MIAEVDRISNPNWEVCASNETSIIKEFPRDRHLATSYEFCHRLVEAKKKRPIPK